ncbi:hypothetical protein K491DRAFT_782407 [Lophiostoma macrostomum CBS 122681]|uniref:BTB domain-containing protein n=1 Tax=Lophiostoma macrostomum CBS 122681 TaxID=1314788 RepID=A0A6A6SSE8_9PLEO|nr:hypothetical protein K491DRAFT_782407 [Lophiostoma macrostomum CBS 122681]
MSDTTLLHNETFSDVTVCLPDGQDGPKHFLLHRAILVQKSGYFRTLLINDSAEASAKCIKLSGHNESAFEEMLHYIYNIPIDWNARLAMSGDDFDETHLPAISSFCVSLFKLAEEIEVDGMQEALQDQLQRYISNIESQFELEELIRAIYASVQKPGTALGKTVARAAARNYHCHPFDGGLGIHGSALKELITEFPIIAADQVLAEMERARASSLFGRYSEDGRLFCQDCGTISLPTEYSVEIRHNACGKTFPRMDLDDVEKHFRAGTLRSEPASPGPGGFSRTGSPSWSDPGDSPRPRSRDYSLDSPNASSIVSSTRAPSPGFESPPASPSPPPS